MEPRPGLLSQHPTSSLGRDQDNSGRAGHALQLVPSSFSCAARAFTCVCSGVGSRASKEHALAKIAADLHLSGLWHPPFAQHLLFYPFLADVQNLFNFQLKLCLRHDHFTV